MSTHEPGLSTRIRLLARGPQAEASDCAHNYIVHHINGKTVYICTKCGSTIQ